MVCIEIALNDKPLWRAGLENAVVLSSTLSSLLGPSQAPVQLLAFGMCRLSDGRIAIGHWGESTPVHMGDVVRFTLVESDSPTSPTQLNATDSPESLQAQRLMDEFERSHVPPDTIAVERRPGLAYRCSINGVYRAMATRKPQAEYLNCTLEWEAGQPRQLHCHVSSGSASRPGHGWETERFRASLSLGESLEVQLVASLALVEAQVGGRPALSGGGH